MKVMITGSKGQLGQELLGVFSSQRADIGAIADAYGGCTVVCADTEQYDIADMKATKEFVAAHRPDVIFHCAAMTNVDACEGNAEAAMRVNALGARNVAMSARETGAKLVHISTDYVFSGDSTMPYLEWDTPSPNTVYGKSKLLGEQYVFKYCPDSFVVRTSWLYSRFGTNFPKTICKSALSKKSLTIVNDQIGNPTYANDLAYHLIALALTEEYGLYHCTGEGECSWYEFAFEILSFAGISCVIEPCTTKDYPRPAPRPAFSSLQNQMLACSAVGNRMRDWKDALRSFMKHYGKEIAV